MKRYKKYFLMENSRKLISEAIPIVSSLLEEKGIEYCIIGGSSLPEYNLNRGTDDIDFLIAVSDKSKIESLIGTYFKPAFSKATRKLIHNETGVIVELMYSKEVSGAEGGLIYKSPKELSKKNSDGIYIITLKNLVEYKLSSGMYGKRTKDLGDVEGLIQANNLKKDYGKKFRIDLQKEYERLWQNTKQ